MMETITTELIDQKAYKILKDLEELNIIKFVKKPGNLSSLRQKIQTKMSNEDIDKQLDHLRQERYNGDNHKGKHLGVVG